jgi:hypothetical protein
MVTQSFKIKKKDFEGRPITIFQHKLRALMKCYTIVDIVLNEIDYTITFKKNHKINGVRMHDPKEYVCKYEVIETENESEIILKIMI